MKLKNNTSVFDEKNTTEQQKTDSSAPKVIEPLTVVPPTKPKKKTASKLTSKKKKTVKKGDSKVALSLSDLYEKENPFKANEEGTTAQASKNTDDEDTSKIASDVATPVCEKGNPDSTLISDESDAIESTEKHGCK